MALRSKVAYSGVVLTAIVTFVAFGLMMLAMAIGVMVGRKPLKGSCGGVGGDCACEKAGEPGACKVKDPSDFSAPGSVMQLGGLSSAK